MKHETSRATITAIVTSHAWSCPQSACLRLKGDQFQSLVHPPSANFYEWVTIARRALTRFEFRAQANTARYGDDSANVNEGEEIFKPYNTSAQDYGNYTTRSEKRTSPISTAALHTSSSRPQT
jgi:hypothetical protein